VAADIQAGDCLFRAQGSTLRFPGFTAVYVESREESEAPAEEEAEAVVPPLAVGEELALLALDPKQHFTQPPPRYTEASLIKLLEERGIGRPSTYAQIMSTIQERGYVRREKGTLSPTELGLHVTDFLVPLFPGIMDVEFTAQLEEELDKIEEGLASWTGTLRRFYKRFEKELREAGKHQAGATEHTCPQCGRMLLERWGRYGKFLACSGYPACKYTQDGGEGRARTSEVVPGETCEQCGKPMVIKEGRYGKFMACQGYPDCRYTKPLTTGIACPEDGCGGRLVERRSRRGKAYYACSRYPECKFILWQRPVPAPCPKCGAPFLVERGVRGRRLQHCFRDGCDYRQEADTGSG
jgi:DNA topoisomerase-1